MRISDWSSDVCSADLLISYGPGAGIGWHRDRPVFEHVIGISLGAPATMRFRRKQGEKFARFALPLAPRSIYHLKDEVRTDWEHSIAAMEVPRWRSEEHTSELQSLMRISYAVFCSTKKKPTMN